MITYTMGINLEYLRIVITIWREYGMLCPIIIAGAKRLVKEIEK